jgi:hypothetical protein
MSEATFRLAYDGEAVRNGEMEVSDLAPALLGMAQLLKATARLIDGEDADVSVRVKTTKDACFEVWLALSLDSVSAAWNLAQTPGGAAALAILSFLGINAPGVAKAAAGGAIGLVRSFKGRRPDISLASPGNVAIVLDGVRIEVPDTIARLALDAGVRAALEKVISAPLERDGIESVSLGDGPESQKIEKAEGGYFRALTTSADDEFVSRHTKAFAIQTLSFKPGQKWRLHDGHAPVSVTMSDDNFQAKVDAGIESFAKGDILVCEVVESSRKTATGFRSDYEVVSVREHRHSVPDPVFGFIDPSADVEPISV